MILVHFDEATPEGWIAYRVVRWCEAKAELARQRMASKRGWVTLYGPAERWRCEQWVKEQRA